MADHRTPTRDRHLHLVADAVQTDDDGVVIDAADRFTARRVVEGGEAA